MKWVKWVVLCVLLVGIGMLMHMHRYEYINHSVAGISYVVRIDRLTGHRCYYRLMPWAGFGAFSPMKCQFLVAHVIPIDLSEARRRAGDLRPPFE